MHRFQNTCTNPFVWDRYGIESKMTTTDGWENGHWQANQPDCYQSKEFYIHARSKDSYATLILNDIDSGFLTCAVCQIFEESSEKTCSCK